MRKDFGAKTWFYPMPVAMIGTYDKEGNADLMPAAWAGVYDEEKVVICIDKTHKTWANLNEKGAFTLSFATRETLSQCDYLGVVSWNKDRDKIEKSGLTFKRAGFVDVPLFNELPLAIECVVEKSEGENFVGKIINVSCSDDALDENGKIDTSKLDIILYDAINIRYRSVGEDVGKAFRSVK